MALSDELKLCRQKMTDATELFSSQLDYIEALRENGEPLNAKIVRIYREILHKANEALLAFEEYQERFYCEQHNLLAVCFCCSGLGCSTCEGED